MFKCHFCGREITAFDVCPVCGWTLKVIGTGTERIEESLKRMFKDKSVVRVDADSMTSPDRIVEVLDALRRGRIDILVGTRMVVGGIKLEGVKLVVVTDIDGMLAMPDYSSRLRTFQLLVEISEMMEGGKVIVQHYGMDPDFLRYVERWDIEGFYEDEMRRRCEAKYPPCGDVVQAIYSSSDEKLAEDMVREVARELNEEEVLGPAPYAVPKLRGKYVYHFLVKTDNTPTVLRKLEKIISRYDRRNWKILRNPPSLVLL